MKIADTIESEERSLKERGLHEGSYFEITFSDGSKLKEHDCNWSEISEETRVSYFGKKKTVMLCVKDVSKIEVYHNELFAEMEVPSGQRVYQAVFSEAVFTPSGRKDRILGRRIGLVEDGEVSQELFLNGLENIVLGFKK